MKPLSPGLVRGVLVLAAIQGVLADLLLRTPLWGLNLGVWALAGVAGLAIVAWREGLNLPAATWAWLAAACGCAGLISGRAAEFLTGLTVVAGAGCLVCGAWTARGGRVFRQGLVEAGVEAVMTAGHAGLGVLAWGVSSAATRGTRPPVVTNARGSGARMVLGGLAAAPVLAVFIALFASADPVFAQGVRSVVQWDFQTLLVHAVFAGAWAWIAAGYARRVVAGPGGGEWSPGVRIPPPNPAPVVEVQTGLGLLAVLFLAFVGIQMRYLFGDDHLVQTVAGMTYAEYARRGFFELLAVAVLLLPVLLGANWLTGGAPERRGFQVLAGLLLALLGVILVSAWKRLGLYTAAYGMTELRLYAAAALVWVALAAGWLAVTVLPRRLPGFTGGAWIAALAVLLGLHGANPDAWIARHNLARARAGLELDVRHLQGLGADAAPVLIDGLPALPPEARQSLAKMLQHRWGTESHDWRHSNLGRRRAHRAFAAAPPGTFPPLLVEGPAPAPSR